MHFPLENTTIFMCLAGSQAHGTAGEGSDVDLRGVCIAPLDVRLALFKRFEQYEGTLPAPLLDPIRERLASHPTASQGMEEKIESVVFDVAKFVGLLAAANPNALEILFADPQDWCFDRPPWPVLHDRRHLFLTQKVRQTYVGYGMAQLRRIRSHRSWLLEPPQRKPSRADFGLPDEPTLNRDDQHRIEQAVAGKLKEYELGEIELDKATRIALSERLSAFHQGLLAASPLTSAEEVATASLGLPDAVVTSLAAERKYRAALKHWGAYQSWKTQRNPARAALEAAHGYDTKHAMHLIRLLRTGLEIVRTGDLKVRRADAEELMAIRRGALPFSELEAEAEALEAELGRASDTSALPRDIDREEVDRLLLSLLEQATHM
ncbi:MAG: nucleotidyltransferase domain-containing protein [Myxococcota bacterium]